MSLAGFDVTRFIALTAGTAAATPNIAMISPARAPAALIVTRALDRRTSSPVSTIAHDACRVMRPPSRIGCDRLDVVGEVGAGAIGRGGERERQPVGLDHLVVVPLRAAGQLVRPDAGEEPQRRGLRDAGAAAAGAAPARRRRCGRRPSQRVEPERRAQREPAA